MTQKKTSEVIADNELIYNGWRPYRFHSAPHKDEYGKMIPVPATRFFDNMSYIGDTGVGCFVVETNEGLIQIDCRWPKDEDVASIEQGYKDLGLDIKQLKAIIITHGHIDHYGKADYFREKYGCKIYMSKIDYEIARKNEKHRLEYEINDFLTDGMDFTLGNITIKCVHTPGHSLGCMSMIIPVYDEGRLHHVGLWGGTGIFPQTTLEEKKMYLESIDKFSKIGDEYNVDAEISAHPFVDCSIERFELVRKITNGVANPFIIGHEAYKRYEDMFRQMCLKTM